MQVFSFPLALLLPTLAVAQEPQVRLPDAVKLIAAFDSIVPAQMTTSHIPGAVLVIVKDGQVYASRGWGVSDVERNTPVSPDRTIFRIGSITKVFTANAVMQQVDRGRLSLEQEAHGQVRIKHLLTHTAAFDEISTGRRVFDGGQVQPLEVFLRNRLIPRRAPGLISSYSTYGIALAGQIVEKASGLSLRDYFQREIFGPLEMTRASHGQVRDEHRSDVAIGYEYINGRYRQEPWEYFHTHPASDINASAADMAKFMIAHLEGARRGSPILSDTATRLMHTVHFRNDPRILGMSYGFMEQRFHGYRALYHGGTMAGYKASLWLWPDQRMGLFLAYNREINDLERRVLNRFAARALVPALDSLDTEGTTWTKPIVRDDLQRFVGQYRQDTWCHTCAHPGWMPPALDVMVKNDSTLTFWGGEWRQVEPLLFRLMNGQLDFGQLYVAFKADANGRIIGLATGGPWFSERIE